MLAWLSGLLIHWRCFQQSVSFSEIELRTKRSAMEGHNQVFDICIVCAMYEEAEAVLDEFSERCSVSFESAFSQMSHYAYRYTMMQNKRKELLRVLVTWPSDRGPVQTGLDLSLI